MDDVTPLLIQTVGRLMAPLHLGGEVQGMHYHRLYRVARKAAVKAKARGEEGSDLKRAVSEALSRAEPSLDQARVEELAGAALLDTPAGGARRRPNWIRFWATLLISLVLAALAIPVAGFIGLYGLLEGSRSMGSKILLLTVTMPVSLVVWPFAGWFFGDLGLKKTARLLCAVPVVHFIALTAISTIG